MKSAFYPPTLKKAGFSLVELLVAVSILSIMLIGCATAMEYVSRLWLSGVGAMDNFTKARVVLNLLDRDIQMMVLRRDLAAFVDKSGNAVDSNGNPICAFYTNVQGNPGADARNVSLVQYLLETPTTKPTLQRLNYGMNFFTSASATATPSVGNLTALPAPANNSTPETETVFTGIIRFQIQFVDGTGANLTPPYTPTGSSSAPGPFSYDFLNQADASNPRSVVVSMLVLNNAAFTAATQGGGTTMTKLLGDFPNSLPSAESNQTFSQYWNGILNPATGMLDPSLPPSIRGGIQVFERHIPLPVTSPSL